MAELRTIEIPPHLEDIKEFKEVDRVSDRQMLLLEVALENLENDILISTSTRKGIERRERILGIIPRDAVNIDKRRANVLLAWYDVYPYTRLDLQRRLDILCGKGRCTVTYNAAAQTMHVAINLRAKDQKEDIEAVLEKVVPLMIIISTEIIYNKWSKYKPWSWHEVKAKTWGLVKEGVEEDE
jgi:hypothetical protein